jgi:hypothetical protein
MTLDFCDGLYFGLGFIAAKGFVELLKLWFLLLFVKRDKEYYDSRKLH